ncbi:uncharacterized protein [Leptinotarsa decemlineata]|uniref:uncharacterized protein n=1 Tax=Leptinotarsa decemlineata TaxID=7539 RepID=UPI000C2541C6|nr:uncharacterized protein LOC111508273 [Leptinotarsa decemlineata]
MGAVHKIFLLAFVLYSANGYLKEEDFGEAATKIAIPLKEMCMEITGASQEVIDQYKIGHFVENEKAQRYVLCLWRVSGLMDKNLKLNETFLDSILPQKERDADFPGEVKKCHAVIDQLGDEENYQKIFEFEKCLFKLDSADFIMF